MSENQTVSPRIRQKEVRAMLGGISASYLFDGMRRGLFPPRFKESAKFSYWLRNEIEAAAQGLDWRAVRPDEPLEKKTLDGRDRTRGAA